MEATPKINTARKESTKAEGAAYFVKSRTSNEIGDVWFDILANSTCVDDVLLQEFKIWTDQLERPLFTPTWTNLARIAAHTPNFGNYAYNFAQQAFELTKTTKEDAESKGQTYVKLARAILIKDNLEAKEYFNQAMEVASKIGDEILDRWQAILHLADRAANQSQPSPQTAYKLARCAELAYKYDDDHFEWDGTITAIAGLCPSSCFAILSRWRDRDFGWSVTLLTKAISVLQDRENIDPKIVTALLGFHAPFEYDAIFKKVVHACSSHSHRENLMNYVLHYMSFDEHSPAVWQKFKEISGQHALALPNVDQLIEHSYRQEVALANANTSYSEDLRQESPKSQRDWDSIFLDFDLHNPNGLSHAFANFKSSEPPFYREPFFAELFSRIPPGKEVELIQVFSETAEFGLSDVKHFLEQLPEEWKPRMAVRSSLGKAVRKLCVRHCMEITKNRYYEPFPLQLASELSGIFEPDLIGVVVTAIGKRMEIVSAGSLFTLVGLLSTRLTPGEALDVLNSGLNLFDDALDEDDGDGPWTEALAPPPDINQAIAGYIWAALAAPQASLRWEAAHVVRGLCTSGGQVVLDHLVEFAKGRPVGPFADGRLHFYHLHARQWLMIALARAASENPTMLVSHSDFFICFALNHEPHVVIRHFAARAALILAESGSLQLDENTLLQLASVNCSELPVVPSKRYRGHPLSRVVVAEKNRFGFDYDMNRYWFEPLGDCFGKNSSDIESEAEKVIWDDWELSEDGGWNRDERNRRSIFRDSETRHSHGSYPRSDGLSFYLSYHAMMTVAGKLLATIPLHHHPDYSDDGFESWLSRHLLSRQDGYWLADRRDPIPLEWANWKNQKQEDDWRWSVRRSDFDRLLGLREDRLNLNGYWKTVFRQQEEIVRISSALVTSDRSEALLRAFQTATDSRDYRIPDAGDEMEIGESGFQLKGWVENRYSERALDEFDPWAGGIQYPPLKPAKFVRDLLQLGEDSECRVWQLQTENMPKEVLWSQVWGSHRPQDNESEGEEGQRLQASQSFVTEFLGKMNMDLIVEVQIERSIRRHHYERSQGEDHRYVPPYFRIFVLRADGQTYSL